MKETGIAETMKGPEKSSPRAVCVSVCTCVAAAVADAGDVGGDAAGEAEEPQPGSVLPAQPLTFTNSEPR